MKSESTISCIIVDDEPLAIDILRGYIGQIDHLELMDTCTDAMSAFRALNQHKVDLLFLDIEMPEMSGIDFIRSLSSPPKVIFTTAHREYAIESYDLSAVDYLLKPISFSRFFKAVSKLIDSNSQPVSTEGKRAQHQTGSIYVYADKKNIKLQFDDILYLESLKDYVRIFTVSKSVTTKNAISRLAELLPKSFLRVHRSFIVNTTKITAFTHQDVEIEEKQIPIGASYKKGVIESLKGTN